MNKIFMTGLCLVASRLIQGAGTDIATNVTKLQLEMVYTKAVKISRLFCLSLLGSGACLIFLLMALILIHHTIIVYATWDISVKIAVTLVCAFLYILIAVGIFAYVFAEDKWMKMFDSDAKKCLP